MVSAKAKIMVFWSNIFIIIHHTFQDAKVHKKAKQSTEKQVCVLVAPKSK